MKILHKIRKNLIFLLQILYFMNYHSKIHIKVSKWQKCDFAHYILCIFRLFYAFLKILHKIWKNPIFLPQISYFMTYHSKIHNKVSKINSKLCKPIFCPFWTPVTIWKLKNPPTKILVFDIKWLVNDHWKVPQCLFAWLWQNIF